MFKVLLADDEPWVLYGLEHIFQWEKWGFQVAASVQSSLEAYEIVCREKIDVVFSDINMPDMDGIALLEKIKGQMPEVTVVMISGYSEFDYAKRAIRYGAYDYLLKPIDEADSDAFLLNLSDYLSEKTLQESRRVLEQIREGLLSFDAALSSDAALPGAADRLPCRQAVMVRGSLPNPEIRLPEDCVCRHLKFGRHESLYLCRCAADLQEALRESLSDSMTIGCSLPLEDGDARGLVGQARMAAMQPFFTNKSGLYRYVPTDRGLIRQINKRIGECCENADYRSLASWLRQLPENALNVQDVVFLWNQFRLYCREEALREFDYTDAEQLLEDFKDYDSWVDMIACVGGQGTAKREEASGRGLYLQMLDYIQEHYAEPLFLRDLSDRFALNFTYCSELFGKYSGTTFSKYLTKYRLEKAAGLLLETGLSVETICFQCGYNEYAYFNRVFKKKFGATPFQYRKERNP